MLEEEVEFMSYLRAFNDRYSIQLYLFSTSTFVCGIVLYTLSGAMLIVADNTLCLKYYQENAHMLLKYCLAS